MCIFITVFNNTCVKETHRNKKPITLVFGGYIYFYFYHRIFRTTDHSDKNSCLEDFEFSNLRDSTVFGIAFKIDSR